MCDVPLAGMLAVWPNCTTPDCDNKQCTWADVPYCFPCAERRVGREEIVRRYNATHDLTWDQATALDQAEEHNG